ncbi:META domain-containing protein [Mangrovicoccus sp. HB161399]|uniref:META domain-containing protein n=1 Tax=Mangrovicoccus sp. HB161399 TaxID=2720392 RepID=UPI001555E515|nr:META domain-containing protein [Mangrovicoccus sp. HB161399]
MKHLICLAALAAAPMAMAQTAPETETEFRLAEMDGAPYEGSATLIFPEDGRVAGKGPCNNFMGRAEWGEDGAVSFGPLASTMMACPDLDAEKELLKALGAVSKIEMQEDGFLLTTDDGATLLYLASAPAE